MLAGCNAVPQWFADYLLWIAVTDEDNKKVFNISTDINTAAKGHSDSHIIDDI